MMEQTAAAPTAGGSAVGGNTARNRLSRVVFAASCQAIIRPDTRIAWRAAEEFGSPGIFMLERLASAASRGWILLGMPAVRACDSKSHGQPDQGQHQVDDRKALDPQPRTRFPL